MSDRISRLSIMLVIPSLQGGGAERVVVNLSNQWQLQGHDVFVLTQTSAETDVYKLSDRVVRLSMNNYGQTGFWGHIKKIMAMRRMFQRYRPDIVIGVMTSSSVYSVMAATALPIQVIATEHAYPPSQKLSSFWQRLRRFTYHRAAVVVALTHQSAEWIKLHVPGAKLAVIPNAVNWPLVDQEPVVPCRKPVGSHMLLAVGRLHYEKGFDLLIQAFARIVADYPQWNLVILGEGGERVSLQSQIRLSGLSHRILMPGRVGNLSAWYEAADLFVLTSRAEGLSNCLQEAMASGLPVLSYDCDTGPRELIIDEKDGILVRPVGDVAALEKSLRRLIDHPELRQDLGLAALDMRDRFSMRIIAEQWHHLFTCLFPDV